MPGTGLLRRIRVVAAVAVLAVPSLAVGQQEQPAAPPPTVGPPIQRIVSASAVSTEPLGAITGVRELRDGRVLLNDGARRRLLLLDTTLTNVEVVLDSLSEVANTYGVRAGALIPFRGDSVLFVDPASFAIVVLDAEGKVSRTRAVWRTQDVSSLMVSSYGVPGVDAKGRVVYRMRALPEPPRVPPPAGVPYFPPEPDSAFIVAVDLDTRRLDTLGVIRIPKTEMRVRRSVEGFLSVESVTNPVPTTDDWAVLPDGSIAFVRWRDYRIEYLQPDGTVMSSSKLPYEWQRLLDEDKERLVDSVKTVQQRSARTSYIANMIRWVNMYGRGYPEGFTVPEGFVPPPGIAKDWILPPGLKLPENYVYACPPGVEPAMLPPPPSGASTNVMLSAGMPAGTPSCMPAPIVVSGGTVPPPPSIRQVFVMPASELPDFRPPFATGAVRADLDGNLWIRTIPPKPIPGGPVYDIVNRAGELVNRMQLPQGYTLVGFGRGKVVFLSMRDASGIHLARVRLR
jgi:hypothetical protein